MKKIKIDQIVAGFMPGDAISGYALKLREIFRGWGYGSELFAPGRHIDRRARHLCRPLGELPRGRGGERLLVYHFSIASPATGVFREAGGTRVLVYHNITPARYFYAYSPRMAALLDEGRRELRELRNSADLALSDSEFNRHELMEAGFPRTAVIPLSPNLSFLDSKPDRRILFRYRGGGPNLLFVGRIAPNKKYEDLLKVFYYFKKTLHPRARLFLVGNTSGNESYLSYLRTLIKRLDLSDVIFPGHHLSSKLHAYYRLGDVFLCLSEHEGFCLPLLEAMRAGLPVLAYAAAAVPETMDGAGILVNEKNYPEIAELASLLATDRELRERVLAGQERRLREFASVSLADRLKAELAPWLE
jgi:glycosyltransferase involved in cell wall biosynthesis